MLQEHHLLAPDALLRAQQAARGAGWQVLFLAAVPSPGTCVAERYNTGGVAVTARLDVTLQRLPGAHVPGRALVVRATGLCDHGVTVASVYLHTGAQYSEDNLQLLAEIAEMVQRPGGCFVIGGDFQFAPQRLARRGFARRLGARIVAHTGKQVRYGSPSPTTT